MARVASIFLAVALSSLHAAEPPTAPTSTKKLHASASPTASTSIKKPFSFENTYTDERGLLHKEPTLIPAELYEARHRIVLQTNGKYWVRGRTLMSLRAESVLPDGAIVVGNKAYKSPFKIFVTGSTNLVVQSRSKPTWKKTIDIQVDDEGPIVLLHFLGPSHRPSPTPNPKEGPISIVPSAAAVVVAYDSSVSMKGVEAKLNGEVIRLFRDLASLGKPISFAEPSSTLEVVAEDALGNLSKKTFSIQHDTKPPGIEWSVRRGKNNSNNQAPKTSNDAEPLLYNALDLSVAAEQNIVWEEGGFLFLYLRATEPGRLWYWFDDGRQKIAHGVPWREWSGPKKLSSSGRVLVYAEDVLGNATKVVTFVVERSSVAGDGAVKSE